MRTSNPTALRAAVYARKSTDDRSGGESNSVREQVAECLAVVKREGWELVGDGRELAFVDDGISGRAWPTGADYEAQAVVDDLTNEVIVRMPKKRRPGFGRMLDAITTGQIDVVVVRDMPRLARPVFQSLFSVFLPTFFPKYNTSLYSLADGFIDYRDFSRAITLMLTDAMVDRELRIRARHAKNAVDAKKNAGNHMGGKSIFGMDCVRDEKGKVVALVPNEQAGEVKSIFSRFSKGVTFAEIARDYTQKGIESPKGRQDWNGCSVRYICKNPVYAGLIKTANGLVKCHQVKTPIISSGLYHTVADLIAKHRRYPNRSVTSGGIATGLLFCGNCGKRFGMRTGPNNRRYGCTNSTITSCHTTIRVENLDQFLLSFYPLKPLVEAEKNQAYQAERTQLPTLRKEEQDQLKRIGNFQDAIKKLDTGFEEALNVLKEMKEELTRIQRKIALIETLPVIENHSWSTDIDTDVELNEKRQFFRDLFSKIIFHRDHAVFHLVTGESFTVKRTNGRYRWLHIPLLFEHGAAQARMPNIRIIRSASPLTHLMYFIDPRGLDESISLLDGKLHITPVRGKLPMVESWGRSLPKSIWKRMQENLRGFLAENFPEHADLVRPFEDSVEFE